MVVAQKQKEAEITEQDSLLLTRNLLRIAVFNISYIRGIFPEKYFNDKSVPALEMKIKKLMPLDAESRRLIDWMEKGVYDALQKKYLRTLLFCICEDIEGPTIEEYAFSFSYSNCESDEVSMNINRNGSKNHGTTFKASSNDITPNQMRSAACKMVRTLIQLMRTLDRMPEERTILMKLMYYDDVTPPDYEPPFFRSCSEKEVGSSIWARKPLKMEVGSVNSRHLMLALKVKSVLDPCEDENEEFQDDEVSLGGDSQQEKSEDSSSMDTDRDQYIVAPAGDKRFERNHSDDICAFDEDNTQDVEEEAEKFSRVRDWIDERHTNNIDLSDILSHFTDISVALIEEIVDKLSEEGVLTRIGKDTYSINNKEKKPHLDLNLVKDEMDFAEKGTFPGGPIIEDGDFMYMKALYHALPMDYVTVTKLQSKLDGDAKQGTVRKLMNRMVQDGYIEGRGNRKLGKRVIHSETTTRKLMEIQKVLNFNQPELAGKNGPSSMYNPADPKVGGPASNVKDVSTCGGLHSIGSELTRTHGRSDDVHQNTSMHSDDDASNAKALPGARTPNNMAIMESRESTIPAAAKEQARISGLCDEEPDAFVCSGYSQERRTRRKASTVKEPILQSTKRQKSQPV